MKKLLPLLILLAGCTKEPQQQLPTSESLNIDNVPPPGGFGFKHSGVKDQPFFYEAGDFAPVREELNSEYTKRNVVLVTFEGYDVSGTNYNAYSDTLHFLPSGLTSVQKREIMNTIARHYTDTFKVLLTTYEPTYYRCDPANRMRVVITGTTDFVQAGGVSYTNSFSWGNDTPCAVFSTLLHYNTKWIGEAASHEIGHTMGLRHQALYDANCVKISDYNPGSGGRAPIMGVSYYQPVGDWWVGPNPYGCANVQDDKAILNCAVGYRHPGFRKCQ